MNKWIVKPFLDSVWGYENRSQQHRSQQKETNKTEATKERSKQKPQHNPTIKTKKRKSDKYTTITTTNNYQLMTLL